MAAAVEVSQRAYCTLMLHALKRPHAACNGVLVGPKAGVAEEAVPLFHSGLALAPMLEVALAQVEAHYAPGGMRVVGYYHANERMGDNKLGAAARAIAEKVCSRACSASRFVASCNPC